MIVCNLKSENSLLIQYSKVATEKILMDALLVFQDLDL